VRKGRRAVIQVRGARTGIQGEKVPAIQARRARTEYNKNTGLEIKEQQYRCGEQRQEYSWGEKGAGIQVKKGRNRKTKQKRKNQEYMCEKEGAGIQECV
jgi:hypothetical protein